MLLKKSLCEIKKYFNFYTRWCLNDANDSLLSVRIRKFCRMYTKRLSKQSQRLIWLRNSRISSPSKHERNEQLNSLINSRISFEDAHLNIILIAVNSLRCRIKMEFHTFSPIPAKAEYINKWGIDRGVDYIRYLEISSKLRSSPNITVYMTWKVCTCTHKKE